MRCLPCPVSSASCVSLIYGNFSSSAPISAKIRRDHLRRHILDARRRPFWIAVLVDHGGAHAFAEIVGREHLQRGAIFPHQAFFQRGSGSRQPQQLQRHHHAARRFFAERLQRRQRQFRTVSLQGGDDVLHPVMREPRIDLRLHRGDRAGGLAGRKTIDQGFDFGRIRAGTELWSAPRATPAICLMARPRRQTAHGSHPAHSWSARSSPK